MQCDICQTLVPTYDGVYLTNKDKTRFLCSKCYNESIAESIGLNFNHLSFHPITLADKDDENHTFHFQTQLFGDKVIIEALEIKDEEPRGYEFAIHGGVEEDLFNLFAKLVARMRRELARRHIEASNLTRYQITNKNVVRGRITWDNDTDGEVPCLVIDGKEFSWHDFGGMLMTYERFHFKLEIFESSEEK